MAILYLKLHMIEASNEVRLLSITFWITNMVVRSEPFRGFLFGMYLMLASIQNILFAI